MFAPIILWIGPPALQFNDGPDPCPNDAEHSSFIQMMRCASIFGAYWPENSVESVIKESTNRVCHPSSYLPWSLLYKAPTVFS